jgi:hypothetical protein
MERNLELQHFVDSEKGSMLHMTPILIALVGVLPLAVAGLSLLFVSGDSTPHNPHHHAINLWRMK